MAKEFLHGPIKIDTKESFNMIKGMDKELCSGLMEDHGQELGMQANNMVEEFIE